MGRQIQNIFLKLTYSEWIQKEMKKTFGIIYLDYYLPCFLKRISANLYTACVYYILELLTIIINI